MNKTKEEERSATLVSGLYDAFRMLGDEITMLYSGYVEAFESTLDEKDKVTFKSLESRLSDDLNELYSKGDAVQQGAPLNNENLKKIYSFMDSRREQTDEDDFLVRWIQNPSFETMTHLREKNSISKEVEQLLSKHKNNKSNLASERKKKEVEKKTGDTSAKKKKDEELVFEPPVSKTNHASFSKSSDRIKKEEIKQKNINRNRTFESLLIHPNRKINAFGRNENGLFREIGSRKTKPSPSPIQTKKKNNFKSTVFTKGIPIFSRNKEEEEEEEEIQTVLVSAPNDGRTRAQKLEEALKQNELLKHQLYVASLSKSQSVNDLNREKLKQDRLLYEAKVNAYTKLIFERATNAASSSSSSSSSSSRYAIEMKVIENTFKNALMGMADVIDIETYPPSIKGYKKYLKVINRKTGNHLNLDMTRIDQIIPQLSKITNEETNLQVEHFFWSLGYLSKDLFEDNNPQISDYLTKTNQNIYGDLLNLVKKDNICSKVGILSLGVVTTMFVGYFYYKNFIEEREGNIADILEDNISYYYGSLMSSIEQYTQEKITFFDMDEQARHMVQMKAGFNAEETNRFEDMMRTVLQNGVDCAKKSLEESGRGGFSNNNNNDVYGVCASKETLINRFRSKDETQMILNKLVDAAVSVVSNSRGYLSKLLHFLHQSISHNHDVLNTFVSDLTGVKSTRSVKNEFNNMETITNKGFCENLRYWTKDGTPKDTENTFFSLIAPIVRLNQLYLLFVHFSARGMVWILKHGLDLLEKFCDKITMFLWENDPTTVGWTIPFFLSYVFFGVKSAIILLQNLVDNFSHKSIYLMFAVPILIINAMSYLPTEYSGVPISACHAVSYSFETFEPLAKQVVLIPFYLLQGIAKIMTYNK